MSTGPRIPAWSYSSIKTFETCPRKYQAEKVTKEVPFTDSTATMYGKEVHSAAELFIQNGAPVPPRFAYLMPYLNKLNDLPGDKHCELKLGIKRVDGRLATCDFFDPDVWFRGIADLAIVNGPKGRVVDYKTGANSRYADMRQLALMAACLFLKFQELETVKAALLFVVAEDIITAEFKREESLNIIAEMNALLTQREEAYKTDVWNTRPNGLCNKWCNVLSCPHNGRR